MTRPSMCAVHSEIFLQEAPLITVPHVPSFTRREVYYSELRLDALAEVCAL